MQSRHPRPRIRRDERCREWEDLPPTYSEANAEGDSRSVVSARTNDASTIYEFPREPRSYSPAQLLEIYDIGLRQRGFAHVLDNVTSQYPRLMRQHIHRTTLRTIDKRIGKVVYTDIPEKYHVSSESNETTLNPHGESTMNSRMLWNLTFLARGEFFRHFEISQEHGDAIQSLLQLPTTVDHRDRETIYSYYVVLRDSQPLPLQANFDVRASCDREKRRIRDHRHWWLGHSGETREEFGSRLKLLVPIWLESFIVCGDTNSVLKHAVDWAEPIHGQQRPAMNEQQYANLVLSLVQRFLHKTFIHRRSHHTEKRFIRYTHLIFEEYVEGLRQVNRLCFGIPTACTIRRHYLATLQRLDPCARALYLQGTMCFAFELGWAINHHYSIFDGYRASFSELKQACLPIALVAMVVGRVPAFCHLYIGVCLLGQSMDGTLWTAAWNEVLNLAYGV